ncbi:MAG TPA: ice-binding family protein [Fimbriimonadaceae bacterium]|nr:ice-binding family protein [Fimbriimonadaceae bacterium]
MNLGKHGYRWVLAALPVFLVACAGSGGLGNGSSSGTGSSNGSSSGTGFTGSTNGTGSTGTGGTTGSTGTTGSSGTTGTTGTNPAGPPPVNLGLAGNYAVFADTGISNATSPAAITGNIGVGPGVTSTAITGFALILAAGSPYSTSAQVNGKIYAFDYAPPTPTSVTTASTDMAAAYKDAAGRVLPNFLNLKSGNLAGLTLYPGLYNWGTAVTLPVGTSVTLSGGPNDTWIFQISGSLTTGAGTHVFLAGGARPKNIFWQVAGTSVSLGANATFSGIVLAKDAINFGSHALTNGRLLAQTAVNLDANTVSQPTS